MPPLTLNVQRPASPVAGFQRAKRGELKTKAKINLKILPLFISHLSLVVMLTGCSVIGTNKPAALQVTAKPEAAVFLDGKHIGKTPFFSDQLKAGEHTLKITVSEASYVDKISLTRGTLTVINREFAPNFLAQAGESLSLVPGKKGLFITSMPGEANVSVDGRLVGKTPVLALDLAEGDHKVHVSKDGFASREFTIKTTPKFQLLAQVTLASEIAKNPDSVAQTTPLPQTSKIEVAQTPQGFLRVRQDATVDSPEIGRVKTGDQLEVIQEADDWVKVLFEDPPSRAGEAGKQGWISSQYTKKLP